MNTVGVPLLLACLAGFSVLGAYAWQRRTQRGAWPLALLCLSLGLLLTLTELRAQVHQDDLRRALHWARNVVGASSPMFTLLFVLETCGQRALARSLRSPVLAWPALIGLGGLWLWANGGLLPGAATDIPTIALDAVVGYGSAGIALASLAALVVYAVRSRGRERTRAAWSATALIIGAVGPIYDGFITRAGMGSLSGVFWLLECALFGIAIHRHRVLDALPVAFARVLREIPLGLVAVDHAGCVVSLNDRARDWLMLSSAGATGRELASLGEPASQLAHMQAGDGPCVFDWLVQGRRSAFEVRCAPHMGAAGAVTGRVFLLADVTERERAAQLLEQDARELDRQASGQTRELARITADLAAENREIARTTALRVEAQRVARIGSWSWEREGGHVQVSAELQALLGRVGHDQRFSLDEVIESFHPEDRALLREGVARLGEREDTRPLRLRVPLADGRTRWLLLHAARVLERDADGAPLKVLGTAQDVTESRESELRLGRRGEELRQRLEARSRELVLLSRELDAVNRLVVLALAPELERIRHCVASVRTLDASAPDVVREGLERIDAAAARMRVVAEDARARADAAVLPLLDR